MTSEQRKLREGSVAKREAILIAARELFLRDGFERTSMDAISAGAKVSKRTVYDYYGDKGSLLAAVLEEAAIAVITSLHESLEYHLSDNPPISNQLALEQALTEFAVDISTTVIGSSSYTTLFALTSGLLTEFPPLDDYPYTNAPEEAIAERLAHFHSRGLLEIHDAREAADHFTALTVLLYYSNQPDPIFADHHEVRKTVTGGVKAFMRAYRNPSSR